MVKVEAKPKAEASGSPKEEKVAVPATKAIEATAPLTPSPETIAAEAAAKAVEEERKKQYQARLDVFAPKLEALLKETELGMNLYISTANDRLTATLELLDRKQYDD